MAFPAGAAPFHQPQAAGGAARSGSERLIWCQAHQKPRGHIKSHEETRGCLLLSMGCHTPHSLIPHVGQREVNGSAQREHGPGERGHRKTVSGSGTPHLSSTQVVKNQNKTKKTTGKLKGTYRHVGPSSHKRVCHGVNELTTDPEITQLNLSSRVNQDVRRLHI